MIFSNVLERFYLVLDGVVGNALGLVGSTVRSGSRGVRSASRLNDSLAGRDRSQVTERTADSGTKVAKTVGLQIDESQGLNVALEDNTLRTAVGGELNALLVAVSQSNLWQSIGADELSAVLRDVGLWIGLLNAEVLELTSDLDISGFPLDDDVLWVWDHAWSTSWLEDDSLRLLAVWQPTLDEDLLWLGWRWWETLDDHLTGWWWNDLSWNDDLLAWEWLWWGWWSLTNDELEKNAPNGPTDLESIHHRERSS